ncbi:unnamed protein product [Sympodiomycopsis kandeliae]
MSNQGYYGGQQQQGGYYPQQPQQAYGQPPMMQQQYPPQQGYPQQGYPQQYPQQNMTPLQQKQQSAKDMDAVVHAVHVSWECVHAAVSRISSASTAVPTVSSRSIILRGNTECCSFIPNLCARCQSQSTFSRIMPDLLHADRDAF